MAWTKRKNELISYKIKVDFEDFFSGIEDIFSREIVDMVNDADCEWDDVEDCAAIFNGSYRTDCNIWYSPQTMWEPEEYEVERDRLSDSDEELKQAIIDNAEELVKLLKVKVIENDE